MQSALDEGVFPGAVVLVRLRGQIVYHQAFGLAARIPTPERASIQTIYDLASLTKPLVTATGLVCLVQDGRLDLGMPIQDWLQELKNSAVGRATVGHLLSHRSGLPGWRPYFEQVWHRTSSDPSTIGSEDAEQIVLRLIRDEPLESAVGERCRYSDLGYMLLGFLITRVSGMRLARFYRERVCSPLGINDLSFMESSGGQVCKAGDAAIQMDRIAPTENDPWRGRVIRGEVHDENAYALGGAAGHSGLFGTASAVALISRRWLESYLGKGTFLSSAVVRTFIEGPDKLPGCSWVYGWDTPSSPSASGAHFSSSSFGHLGFTGTSLWIDPREELEVIVLSNRVHPTRANEAIRVFRPQIHDLIYQEFAGRSG